MFRYIDSKETGESWSSSRTQKGQKDFAGKEFDQKFHAIVLHIFSAFLHALRDGISEHVKKKIRPAAGMLANTFAAW